MKRGESVTKTFVHPNLEKPIQIIYSAEEYSPSSEKGPGNAAPLTAIGATIRCVHEVVYGVVVGEHIQNQQWEYLNPFVRINWAHVGGTWATAGWDITSTTGPYFSPSAGTWTYAANAQSDAVFKFKVLGVTIATIYTHNHFWADWLTANPRADCTF